MKKQIIKVLDILALALGALMVVSFIIGYWVAPFILSANGYVDIGMLLLGICPFGIVIGAMVIMLVLAFINLPLILLTKHYDIELDLF